MLVLAAFLSKHNLTLNFGGRLHADCNTQELLELCSVRFCGYLAASCDGVQCLNTIPYPNGDRLLQLRVQFNADISLTACSVALTHSDTCAPVTSLIVRLECVIWH